jgi:hypothetical protein
MGTRSITTFHADGEEICVLYRQFDGEIKWHGKELAEFLAGKTIVNGIGLDYKNVFNGMGCLTASVIAHFKEGVGGFYVYPAKTRDINEEFTYQVYGHTGEEPHIRILEGWNYDSVFSGTATDVLNFIKKEENN